MTVDGRPDKRITTTAPDTTTTMTQPRSTAVAQSRGWVGGHETKKIVMLEDMQPELKWLVLCWVCAQPLLLHQKRVYIIHTKNFKLRPAVGISTAVDPLMRERERAKIMFMGLSEPNASWYFFGIRVTPPHRGEVCGVWDMDRARHGSKHALALLLQLFAVQPYSKQQQLACSGRKEAA